MEALSEELDNRVQSELQARERLVWSGQPIPSRAMWSTAPIVLFAIPWTAFAIFWVVAASGGAFLAGGFPGNIFACFPLFGLPFILIGLAMLGSPFWAYRKARRTCYALTDRRAIVWAPTGFNGTEVRSFAAEDLRRITRRERTDGSGDLIFEQAVAMMRDSDGDMRSHVTLRGFIGIQNVRDVEAMIQKTLLTPK